MRFALNSKGVRIEAEPKLRAICPLCNEEVISKCGDIKVWHFAHLKDNECYGGEPETKWHLDWKDNFPKEHQEVIIKRNDEYYENKSLRADVKTKEGLVIEFQNSPISTEKIIDREEFYENMVWVLNGKTFGKNITYYTLRYKWKWFPKSWASSKKDIYIDEGKYLYKLSFYFDDYGYLILGSNTFKKCSKDAFIINHGGNPYGKKIN